MIPDPEPGSGPAPDFGPESGSRPPQFSVMCIKPGCGYTRAGKTGPLQVIPRYEGYFSVVIDHYRGYENGKRTYDQHYIGKVTPAGPKLNFVGQNNAELLRLVVLRHQQVVERLAKSPRNLRVRHPRRVERAPMPSILATSILPMLPALPGLPALLGPSVRAPVRVASRVPPSPSGETEMRPSHACGSRRVIRKGTTTGRSGNVVHWYQCLDCKGKGERKTKFSPDSSRGKQLTDQEIDGILRKVLLSRHSLKSLVEEEAGRGLKATALNQRIIERLGELPRLVDRADARSVAVLGIDTTIIKLRHAKWRVAYASDALKRRAVHVKVIKSESKALMARFLREIMVKGPKVKLYLLDMSPAELEAVAEVASQAGGLYLIQACLFHLLQDLAAWLPTGKRTWNKLKDAESEKVALHIPRWFRFPSGVRKKIRKGRISREKLELWAAFKKAVVLTVFSVTNAARANNRRLLEEFDSRGDEDIEEARTQVLQRLRYYHTVEDIARFLNIPLMEAFRLLYNNVSEAHVKGIKNLQKNFGGFKEKETTSGYMNAYMLVWNDQQDREDKQAEERARRAALRGKESKKKEFHASFPFALWDDPVNLEELAAALGLDEALLAEGAEAKGYEVLGHLAAPFYPERREELQKVVSSALRRAEGRTLPLSGLNRSMKKLYYVWQKYPTDLAVHLLQGAGFNVETPMGATEPWVKLKRRATS